MKRNSLLFYPIAFSLVALSSPLPLSGQESRFSHIPEATLRMNTTPIRPRQKEKRYELRGVVRSVDIPNRRATIKHEKIGDYMDAMTMPFLIKDENALKTMQPGDQIKATLVVTDDGRQWVENIITTSK
jgi:Cu/Ag efflux protein CusF